MYAFYSLLIYIFYSLFRRDGGAAATGDPEDPAQSAGCKRGGRRRPDQPTAELWTELTGLVGLPGCSESEDGREEGAEGRATEVSLEEALVRLAEFLSVQLGAEESSGSPPDLTKPSDVPPLLTVTGQLLALLAWIRSPRGRQALSQGTQPALEGQCPTPVGSPSREESPSLSPRDEAQGQNPPQLEEDRRAWQRLEQLILGQLEELKQQLELQEEELGRLRLGVGATDSEKRVQHLTLENEALKQSLSLMRDLLLHWGPAPSTRAPQEEAEALVELQGRLQEAQDTTEALQVQLGVQEVQLQGLRGALRQLQQETEQNCRRELQQMHGQLAGLRARMASLRQGCGDLRGLVSTFTQSCQCSLSEARGQVSWALGALSAGRGGTQLPEEQRGPPTGCPGRLLELKGNIRVLCRLRPGTPSSLVSSEPGPSGTVTTCYRGRQRRFRLDWVFSPEASQEEVFRELEPAVLSCLRGYSVCIFTYGQTGTGKTYSMEGPPEDPGIAPRALQSLFQEMGTGGQHRVTLSMVEIYNEAVRDLLAPGPPERLAVRQGPAGQGGIQVAGLTYWDVPNLETLHQMLSLGRSNRATAATSKNRHSSRSHALVTLTLRAASPPRGPGTAGTEARTRAPRVVGAHSTRDQGSLHVGLARPRRHAASGGPGGIRACLEGGGSRPVAGRPRRRPASAGGPDHQSLAAGPGGRDGRAAGPPATRALPRLAAHAPAAAGAGTRRHGGAAAADLHAARGPGGDRVLAEVRRARGPSGAGARPALQGPALWDALLPQHRHAPHRDPLHAHAVPRQPSESRRGERLRLGSRDPKERVLLAWTRTSADRAPTPSQPP
ncbi:kinesin-like protein KIFC2 isoform X2 [Neovison vison]|uniref:kinesin-like protein KIFC2 isoform X2 n=1 Tax=Neovison vison TaxID=452646 RepID=UPI001CF059F0|nr:kinesin-like protein KIFC2 isoform X2 [Neogale vison]